MTYSRKFDFTERAWLAYEYQGRPQAYMLIIEGDGDVSDKQMNRALHELAQHYPVCRSRLSGCLNSLRWEASDCRPAFTRLPDVMTEFTAIPTETEKRIFREPIDIRNTSPLAVFTLYNGHKRRFYIKIHHTAMDGKGFKLLVMDLFNILRGESPTGVAQDRDSKEDLFASSLPRDFFKKRYEAFLKEKKQHNRAKEKNTSLMLPGVSVGRHLVGRPPRDNGFEWQMLTIPLCKAHTSGLNEKLLAAVMAAVNSGASRDIGKLKACIPVDLRYLKPGLTTASNLTGAIMVDLGSYHGMPVRQQLLSIRESILEKAKNHSAVVKTPAFLNWVPIRLMSLMAFFYRKKGFHQQKFPFYFFFTNMGKWPLPKLSTSEFSAERVISIPNMQYYCPLFILTVIHDNGIDIVCASDSGKTSLARFVRQLKTGIHNIEESLSGDGA